MFKECFVAFEKADEKVRLKLWAKARYYGKG